MTEMPVTLPRAAHWSVGTNEPVTRIVLHDEECPVSPSSAESVANYFASPASGGSAHYIVDADSIEHPLPESVIAWHAPPNQGSIGIEHDGYARFTLADWETPGSLATFTRSAHLVAEICTRRGIPPRFLTASMLAANPSVRGVTTHAEVSAAFHQSDHTDPGPQFPINDYLASVNKIMANVPPLTPAWYFRMLLWTPGAPMESGPDVRRVQIVVGVTVDGIFGPGTRSAVVAFQAKHGLSSDGIVGPATARIIG